MGCVPCCHVAAFKSRDKQEEATAPLCVTAGVVVQLAHSLSFCGPISTRRFAGAMLLLLPAGGSNTLLGVSLRPSFAAVERRQGDE